ncbi:hypothetical protein DFP72DRAFT_777985, partial [Ephemerocybe angulata]
FVRMMLITETRFRIIQFDREGAVYSPLVNYHGSGLNTFIRAILSLCSTSERILGLDTSVQWTISKGRKVSGTVTTFDRKSKKSKTYNLKSILPSFTRRDIHGRGTVCWAVTDPDTGRELLIKDAWIWEDNGDRKEEYYYLEKAESVPGIMEMVEYEDRKGQPYGEIDYFRPSAANYEANAAQYQNRIFRRIVVVKYGGDIEKFQSQLEFMCALRDSIKTHFLLFDWYRILHRDISSTNILLGLPGAREGYRGILIDMDHATEIPHYPSSGFICGGALDDHLQGTRLFQAYYVLKGNGLHNYRPIHDYLDDLESFFYVVY